MNKLLITALTSFLLLAAGPAMAIPSMHASSLADGARVTQTNECRIVARWIDPYTGDVYEHVQCVIYRSGRV